MVKPGAAKPAAQAAEKENKSTKNFISIKGALPN